MEEDERDPIAHEGFVAKGRGGEADRLAVGPGGGRVSLTEHRN